MKLRLRILSPPVLSSVGQSGAALEYQSSGKAVKVAFDCLRLKRCSLHVDVQPIAESSFRDEILRSLWIELDLGAQLADADPQTTRVVPALARRGRGAMGSPRAAMVITSKSRARNASSVGRPIECHRLR